MTLAFATTVNGGLITLLSYAGLFSHHRVSEATGLAFVFSLFAIALIYSGLSLRFVEYIKDEQEKKLAEAKQMAEEKAKRMLEREEQRIEVKDSTRNI
ncbi:hypothetical protein M5689_006273 [Euphorbia peplus]|nr:hypothetical protein M5689_006273 [Euphorbia peplus]